MATLVHDTHPTGAGVRTASGLGFALLSAATFGLSGALGHDASAALLIDVPEQDVMRRLSGRRVCVKAGHNFHVDFDPPKHPDRCDRDGSRLIQRDDDREDVVRHRLEEYHSKTEPLIGYYDEQGKLRRIDGTREADQVRDQIRATLAAARFEGRV